MNNVNRFDAHCHIFSLTYALKEAKSLLFDILRNRYPWHKPMLGGAEKSASANLGNLKQLLRWLYETIRAAGTNELENLNFLQSEAKKAYPNDTLSIVPLMMDVFYLFAYRLDKDAEVDGLQTKATKATVTLDELQASWDEVLNDLQEYISSSTDQKKLSSPNAMQQHLQTIGAIEQERSIADEYALHTNLKRNGAADYYHTAGFDMHMQRLMELVATRQGELFPFIAVDPRRKGMVDAVISGRFFEGEQRFYGVKLYPRLGYHPQCKALMPLYEFCNQRELPITYHCGMGGFPPTSSWDATPFGNPDNFTPILESFKKLRLNFAHMGSSDPSNAWRNKVLEQVIRFDNAYTDLSCYTKTSELAPIKNLWNRNPKLQERLMFGTDFDLIYFVGGQSTMQQYYSNFRQVFTPADMDRMMITNPINFLK